MTPEERGESTGYRPGARRIFALERRDFAGVQRHEDGGLRVRGGDLPPRDRIATGCCDPKGCRRLAELGRLQRRRATRLRFVRYLDDAGVRPATNVWTDTAQAGLRAAQEGLRRRDEPQDRRALRRDAHGARRPRARSDVRVRHNRVRAEKLGRRWITIDTSRVALALARERLLTSNFDYYELVDPTRGVDAGLRYDSLHVGDRELDRLRRGCRTRSALRPAARAARQGPGLRTFHRRGALAVRGQPVRRTGRGGGHAEAAADHVSALLDALRTMGIPRKGTSPASVLTSSRSRAPARSMPRAGSRMLTAPSSCSQ